MNWPHSDFEPQIVYYSRTKTWRCLVRPLPDGEFSSLEGLEFPSHGSPDAALSASISAVGALLAAREEALAVEALALLTSDPPGLRAATIPNPEGGGKLKYWQVQDPDDGTWQDPQPTVYQAVKVSREKMREKGGKKGGTKAT